MKLDEVVREEEILSLAIDHKMVVFNGESLGCTFDENVALVNGEKVSMTCTY